MKFKFLLATALLASSFGVFAANELVIGEYNYTGNNKDDVAFDGFNYQNSPILFTYHHSGVQVYYLPEQLEALKGKKITGISFRFFSEEWNVYEYSSTAKVNVQEVDDVRFPYNEETETYSWFPFNAEDFHATSEITADFQTAAAEDSNEAVDFDLSEKPFTYTGKTLLLTVVNDCIDSQTGDGFDYPQNVRFFRTPAQAADPDRSLVFGSDTEDFITHQQKGLVVQATENEFFMKEAAAVMFTYEDNQQGSVESTLDTSIAVVGSTGFIGISTAMPSEAVVVNLAGQTIAKQTIAAGHSEIAVPAGLYVVTIGGKAYKTIVK